MIIRHVYALLARRDTETIPLQSTPFPFNQPTDQRTYILVVAGKPASRQEQTRSGLLPRRALLRLEKFARRNKGKCTSFIRRNGRLCSLLVVLGAFRCFRFV